jgi:hypothetical protein
MADSTGWAVVMGSAWRCTTFHTPSSGLKIIVERREYGVITVTVGNTSHRLQGVIIEPTEERRTVSRSPK